MNANKDFTQSESSDYFPSSTRVYVSGTQYPYLRVPFREISQSDSKTINGEVVKNDPVRVYDCSGPWGDPAQKPEVKEGLEKLRLDWINDRGDVEVYDGRKAQPKDNGYLSEKHQNLVFLKVLWIKKVQKNE